MVFLVFFSIFIEFPFENLCMWPMSAVTHFINSYVVIINSTDIRNTYFENV